MRNIGRKICFGFIFVMLFVNITGFSGWSPSGTDLSKSVGVDSPPGWYLDMMDLLGCYPKDYEADSK